VALKTFEDLDYYCSDNLPVDLLPDFVRSLLRDGDGTAARGHRHRRARHSDLSQLPQLAAAATGRRRSAPAVLRGRRRHPAQALCRHAPAIR
jgi:RNase adaptor protein for sRNA GlmZ degradation